MVLESDSLTCLELYIYHLTRVTS